MTASENLRKLAENPWWVRGRDGDDKYVGVSVETVLLLARALDALECENYYSDNHGCCNYPEEPMCDACRIHADADRLFGNDTEKGER